LTIIILALLTLAALAGLHWYQKRAARHDDRTQIVSASNAEAAIIGVRLPAS
jgi:hypothetical protein